MPLIKYDQHYPEISNNAWIAPNAYITGNTKIGDYSSVFFGCTIRGDINPIIIGNNTNIQEHCILHTSRGLGPCKIGDQVTVGHGVILHGCEIKNLCIIGMGSTILDNVVIEDNCIIGANSLLPKNLHVPAGHLAYGSPAKVVRKLTPEEIQSIAESAESYCKVSANYKKILV